MFFVFSKKEHFYFGILFFFFFTFLIKKRIEELNLVYFIQIGATVTSKSLLKVKTRCVRILSGLTVYLYKIHFAGDIIFMSTEKEKYMFSK